MEGKEKRSEEHSEKRRQKDPKKKERERKQKEKGLGWRTWGVGRSFANIKAKESQGIIPFPEDIGYASPVG